MASECHVNAPEKLVAEIMRDGKIFRQEYRRAPLQVLKPLDRQANREQLSRSSLIILFSDYRFQF